MIGHRKLDSNEVQEELIQKLQSLFTRENLEKDVYFIARMNERMEIPLQVVYQQKDIYKICPNGRYVLHALNKCSNVLVSQEHLYIIPKIIPRKIRIYLRVTDTKITSIAAVVSHIKDHSQIAVKDIQNVSPTSVFLTFENEEIAAQMNEWIGSNKLEGEPTEVSLREENLFKVFKNNVKEELNSYYEKIRHDKKSEEMYQNFEFFQHQNTAPVQNPSRVGDNVFANPYNYFFFQQPGQEQQQKPYVRKYNNSDDKNLNFNNDPTNFLNPLALFMMQQQYLQAGMVNLPGNQRNNHHLNHKNESSQNQKNQNNNLQDGEKKRSRNNNKNNSKRTGNNFKTVEEKDNQQKNDNVNQKTQNSKKRNQKKNIVDNEENFPSLGEKPKNPSKGKQHGKEVDSSKATTGDNKSKNVENQETRVSRKLSADKKEQEKPERNVSESKDRQLERKRETSASHNPTNKHEETVYFRKGKDIQIRYEKDQLVKIFQSMQKTITPPLSIVESSKDTFIPVVNVNAEIEIEVTKPTEVTDNQSHSNPGTPYQGTASVPYRKPSITRSNIKRKEQETIQEVQEKPASNQQQQ